MREIKFRAWEKNLKTMIPVDSIDFKAELINIELAWRMFEEIELMQYTGLKDKNGVEIYEGDILSQHPGGIHFDEEDYQLVIVKKTEYGWSPHVDVIGHKAHDYKGNLFEYIVVGNIYENPELFEEITK